jgi:transcriptional regulator with XRE-family HTH domain
MNISTEVSFGEWLRRRRKARDLTREALADRVGCSVATVRKIEAEERRPSAQIVERLADIFEIPAEERAVFLRFARGDWRAAPTDKAEEAPWRAARTAGRQEALDRKTEQKFPFHRLREHAYSIVMLSSFYDHIIP